MVRGPDLPGIPVCSGGDARGALGGHPAGGRLRTRRFASCGLRVCGPARGRVDAADGLCRIGARPQARPAPKEAQELIAYASGPDATDSEIAIAQQRLAEIEQEAAQIRSGAEGSLVESEQALQDTLAELLRADIEAFAAEQGIDIVVNWGLSGEGVLYGSSGFDITAPLLEYLNARHPVAEKP